MLYVILDTRAKGFVASVAASAVASVADGGQIRLVGLFKRVLGYSDEKRQDVNYQGRKKGVFVTDQKERVAGFAQELRDGPEPSDRSVKEIINALQPQVQELVSRQVELAKTELAPVGKKAGAAVGLIVTGALFLLLFLVFFFLTGMYIMEAAGFPFWAAAGITTIILLLIGGILAGAGAGILRSLDPKPHHTIRTFQQNVNWVKGQFKS